MDYELADLIMYTLGFAIGFTLGALIRDKIQEWMEWRRWDKLDGRK